VTFTVSVGQELTHVNIPLDTVQNRNKTAQIHGLLGLQTFIITLYIKKFNDQKNRMSFTRIALETQIIHMRCKILLASQ
jgi:hypothetical protein